MDVALEALGHEEGRYFLDLRATIGRRDRRQALRVERQRPRGLVLREARARAFAAVRAAAECAMRRAMCVTERWLLGRATEGMLTERMLIGARGAQTALCRKAAGRGGGLTVQQRIEAVILGGPLALVGAVVVAAAAEAEAAPGVLGVVEDLASASRAMSCCGSTADSAASACANAGLDMVHRRARVGSVSRRWGNVSDAAPLFMRHVSRALQWAIFKFRGEQKAAKFEKIGLRKYARPTTHVTMNQIRADQT